jgi:CO/xanthine dehydrogenase Mo-binding subunit
MISPAYSFGVQAVEIELDRETGKYKLVDVTTAHESGTVINPVGITGQLEGAIMMAGGYAYCEDQPMDNGKILNPSIGDYQMIRSLDMPDTNILEIDTYEPEGPFGAKEAGEGLTNPTAAAISNAVFHTAGVVVNDLPITPEKVLNALNVKRVSGKVTKGKAK